MCMYKCLQQTALYVINVFEFCYIVYIMLYRRLSFPLRQCKDKHVGDYIYFQTMNDTDFV